MHFAYRLPAFRHKENRSSLGGFLLCTAVNVCCVHAIFGGTNDELTELEPGLIDLLRESTFPDLYGS